METKKKVPLIIKRELLGGFGGETNLGGDHLVEDSKRTTNKCANEPVKTYYKGTTTTKALS
jgi:hypothetical protein